MENLLTKFRVSNALDDNAGGPLPDALQEKISASPELREFSQRTAALDRALRHPPAAPAPEPALHNSIMRAVRAGATEPAPGFNPLSFGLATAAFAIAVIGVWVALKPADSGFPRQSDARSLAAVRSVLDMGGEISRSVPSSVVGPLTNELACVDQDIQDSTKFVLAMLP
jgi:hypothetical protein